MLDAARANPYAAQGAPLAPGLALVEPEPGVLIAFNAAPGTLAGDEQGPYGVFGKTLAGAMRQGGVDVAEVFDQTRVLVNQETEGALLPWSASKLDGPSFIFERAADAPPPPVLSAPQTAGKPLSSFPAEQAYAVALQRDTIPAYREYLAAFPNSDQARRVRAILAVRREAEFWRRTLDANTPRAYWTYLRAYRKGPHVADARRRLAILSAQLAPPADFEPMEFADLPPPPPDERFYEDRPVYAFSDFGPPPPPPPIYYDYDDSDEWRDLPPPPPPIAVGVLPALEIAIPLFVGAVAYRGHEHRHDRDGLAPPGAPLFAPPPLGPPRLPGNIRPIAPPPPRPIAGGGGGPAVKPLPPFGPPSHAGGPRPGATPPPPGSQPAVAPATPAAGAPAAPSNAVNPPNPPTVAPGGKPPAPHPAGTNPPANPPAVAPGGKPLPAPPSNAGNPPSNAPPLAPAGKPSTLPPKGANPAAIPPGGKLLPVPTPTAAAPPAMAPAGKAPAQGGASPPAASPAGKPLPVPPATAPAAPAPAPGGNVVPPAAAPAAPKGAPLPKVAPQNLAPAAPAPLPIVPKPASPVQHPTPGALAPTPVRPVAPPPPAVHAPIPAPAPPPAALAPAPVHPIAPPVVAPAIHPPAQLAPPPPAVLAPAPVRPPALPAAPAVHAPAQPAGKPGLVPGGPAKPGQPPG